MTDADDTALKALLADRLGFRVADLDREAVHGALQAAVKAHRAGGAEATLTHLAVRDLDDPVWQVLIDRFVVRETSFLRDRDWCDSLAAQALVALVKARRASGRLRLRLWSAGCSTGEECYTLAYLVDLLLPDRAAWDIRIIGSDVCRSALRTAAAGIYRAWSLRTLGEAERADLFERVDARHFRVRKHLRDLVEFRRENLADLKPAQPGPETERFDLIVCRNVMIYFERERQDRLAKTLISRLMADGWLAVGPAEASADRFAPLARVSTPCAIFFRARPDGIHVEPAADHSAALAERLDATRPATPAPAPIAQPAPAAQPIAWPKPAPQPHPHMNGRPAPRPAADPSTPGEHRISLVNARQLADRGQLAEARQRCHAVLEEDSLCHDAHVLLAMIALEADETDEALAAARRAAYVRADSPMAHLLEGMALLRLRQHRQAHRCLDRAMRLVELNTDPDLAEMTAELGIDALLDVARAHMAKTDPATQRRSDARRQ